MPADPSGLRHHAAAVTSLLGGVGLLMLGVGLQGTVLGLRAEVEGFATLAIGVIMSGYYVGYLVGSTRAPALIAQVGHIRVFAALAAGASASMLAHALWVHPVPWTAFRLLTGLCVAGLFVVAESWLNGQAAAATRGRLLALYMVVAMGGLLVGQLLVSSTGARTVGIITAGLVVSVAVIPVALTRQASPPLPATTRVTLRELSTVAPLAVVGVVLAGAGSGVVFGLAAVYGGRSGFSDLGVAVVAAAAVAGALVLQLPLGGWSDRTDRRRVIALAAAGAAVAAVAAALDSVAGVWPAAVALVVIGGLSLPLYPLCLAHLADYLSTDDLTAAGSRLVLAQGAGAAAGPLAGSVAMGVVGTDGFFWTLAAVHAPIAAYALWRLGRRAAVPEDERAEWVPLTGGATPQALAVGEEDDASAPVYPGEVADAGGAVHYRSRGDGVPVVLLHGAGEDATVWDPVAVRLAREGYWAVAVDLPGHGATTLAPSDRMADHVGAARVVLDEVVGESAIVVARGSGVGVALDLVLAWPDVVRGLVLVDPAWGVGPTRRAQGALTRVGRAGGDAARRVRGRAQSRGAQALRRAADAAGPPRPLADVTVPTVVVTALEDPERGWSGAERILDLVGGARHWHAEGVAGRVPVDGPGLVDELPDVLALIGERLGE